MFFLQICTEKLFKTHYKIIQTTKKGEKSPKRWKIAVPMGKYFHSGIFSVFKSLCNYFLNKWRMFSVLNSYFFKELKVKMQVWRLSKLRRLYLLQIFQIYNKKHWQKRLKNVWSWPLVLQVKIVAISTLRVGHTYFTITVMFWKYKSKIGEKKVLIF